MKREVIVDVFTKIKVTIEDDKASLNGVLENMEYTFISQSEGAVISDTQILDWNTTNSDECPDATDGEHVTDEQGCTLCGASIQRV